jgi:hypothetical protein
MRRSAVRCASMIGTRPDPHESETMKKPRPHDIPLRIGILGCANIARQFSRDVAPSPAVRIVAVASRNPQTAAAFAAAQGIGRHHGSYEALLADADVDARGHGGRFSVQRVAEVVKRVPSRSRAEFQKPVSSDSQPPG